MEEKTRGLQSKVNRLQRKNAELFMLADAIQSFAIAKSADQIIDKLLEFCVQLTGARKVFFLSKKEISKKLEEGICEAINPEAYSFIVQQTGNLGITVSLNQSEVKDPSCDMSNCTAIPLRGDLERYVVMIDLPLPESSYEYVEIVSKMADPFVLALKEKEYSDQLVRSEKKYRRLFETSQDGITARDLHGRMIDCNQAYARMVGYSKNELMNLSIKILLPEKWHEQRERIVSEVLKAGGSVVFEREYQRKDGVVFPASVRIWRLTDENGETIGVWSVVRDITQQKDLQKKLQQNSANLEQLVEERTKQLKDSERLAAIGATAGMVGHDIRNPLQAITSDVYLAKTELASISESEEKKSALESLQEIEKNVDYINKIVADLQDFARPLHPLAEEADLKLIFDELLAKNGVSENVKASVKVESEAMKVLADSSYIKRIMNNLVNNAVQAMPHGGKLTIQAYKEAEDVLITVKDTGVGIPKEVQNKLFTPMFTTKAKGQGFGLPVVKRMTEALGGTVTFKSLEGKGTTFTVRLPSAPKVLNGK